MNFNLKALSPHSPAFQTRDRRVILYNADALKLLSRVPSESVDMIFADPPYFGNQSMNTMNRTDNYGNGVFSTGKATWAKSRSLDFQFAFHQFWLAEVKRILKPGASVWVTGTYHSIGVVNVVLQSYGFKILNDIVLHKRNAPPNFKGSCFRAVTESMLWAKRPGPGKLKFNYWSLKSKNGGKQMKNLWEYTATKNAFRHPATKHPLIVETCIEATTIPGDIIIDPFAGSGTTGVVSQALGRECILFEIRKASCTLIKKRLQGKYGRYQSQLGENRTIQNANP